MKHGNKFAWTVRVGERGQFVIPKEARDVFGIKPGDTLLVLADAKKGIAIPPKDKMSRVIDSIFAAEGIDGAGDGMLPDGNTDDGAEKTDE